MILRSLLIVATPYTHSRGERTPSVAMQRDLFVGVMTHVYESRLTFLVEHRHSLVARVPTISRLLQIIGLFCKRAL